jgi:NADH:ubiquinone reductase (H+-translocating)
VSANNALRVVAIEGSETGVEVAGEIKSTWPMMRVTMISRSRCGEFKGERVGQFVRAELARQGVHMIDGETVTEIGSNEVRTKSGRALPFDVCVWSGGLRSPAIARRAGLATDPHGRIFVDPNLRSISHPDILAVGDAARPVAPTGAPYRLSAFVALTSGTHAAEVILAGLANRQLPPFSFSTFGQGISIGRGGVGYMSYPDDKPVLFILQGRTALLVRNIFVWIVAGVLKLELRFPGFFSWLGRKRVSWPSARSAMREVQTA